MSALAEATNAAELVRTARRKFDAEIAQASRAHDEYLAEYGSLGDVIGDMLDAAE